MIFDLPLSPFRLSAGIRPPGLHLRGWAAGPGIEPLRALAVEDRAVEAGPVSRSAEELTALWRRTPPRLDPSVPTVLVVHALTGDAVVGGESGWWSWMVGPGRPIDTDRLRVLCFNHLGSCYGSYGASDPGFPRWSDVVPAEVRTGRGAQEPSPSWRPAPLTSMDLSRAQLLALDALGVRTVERVIGGSVGGGVALGMQVLAPERIGGVVAIACATRSTPWILGWNHLGRTAVLADPVGGLVLARAAAHLSYRAEPGLEARQARHRVGEGPRAPYAMQTYLTYQGRKLQQRFDPAAYVAMLDAMDHHDLDEPVEPDAAVESWEAGGAWGVSRLHDVDAVGISTDQLYYPQHLVDLADAVPHGAYTEIDSPHGHDAFLMPGGPLPDLLTRILS